MHYGVYFELRGSESGWDGAGPTDQRTLEVSTSGWVLLSGDVVVINE